MRSNPCSGNVGGHRIEIADQKIPPIRSAPVIQCGVRLGDPREIRAHLDRGQAAALTHRVEQVQAHRTRTGPGFQHAGARTYVAELNHLRDVLRIHDLCATRHRQNIVGHARPHHRELPAADCARSLPWFRRIAFRVLPVELVLTLGGDGGDHACPRSCRSHRHAG